MSDAPAPTGAAPAASPGTFVDPFLGFNFKLILAGNADAHFTECTGLGARVTPITYKEGGTSQPHRIPGPVDFSEVTLRYGLTNSRQLWDWFLTAMTGKVQRRNLSIVMLDHDGVTPRIQWDLTRAWVTEWRGAPLDAMGAEIAIETVSLVHEGLSRT